MSSSDTRSPPHSDGRRRVCVRVRGVVQGVGFRPHVYRLAKELTLDGYVLNDARGVLLEVEGRPATVERFLERLVAEPPPLATVESVEPRELAPNGRPGFRIAPSRDASEQAGVVTTRQALVSPDTAPCAECLAEMRDPRDRRHRYPFINCTNCGPRFTIALDVPYDRASTTMAAFVMCERCRAEYEDPGDRRFHAQPNACPVCGPRARLLRSDANVGAGADAIEGSNGDRDGGSRSAVPTGSGALRNAEQDATDIDEHAVRHAAELLAKGLIVAVKGLGGYHLACRADFQVAVAVLRARKQREERPFALMVADLTAAEALIELNEPARELLEDRARPIVIARRRTSTAGARDTDAGTTVGVAEAVAPGCPDLGVMLPYTPLHHLLLADFAEAIRKIERADATRGARETGATKGIEREAENEPESELRGARRERAGTEIPPLVMTSGNRSDEPIAYDDEDALARLAGIADAFLVHDRPIHMRTDDSVVRHTTVGPLTMRRSRGYVPGAIQLPVPTPRPLLACGAELKSTFCVARGEQAWVGHHIGDLKNFETLLSFRQGVEHFQRLFAVDPEVVVHDLHPDYLSTGYALERASERTTGDKRETQTNDEPAWGNGANDEATKGDTRASEDPGRANETSRPAGAPARSTASGIETIAVQHHHAHLAACLAEHGETGPAIGAIFDGSGYGPDGTVWGGELLVGDLRDFTRAGHLRPVRLPGGDRAVNEPWRMACAWLTAAEPDGGLPPLPDTLSGQVSTERWETIARLSHSELAPLTTSAGRLFDAVAALCGLRAAVTYEGQAAIELEGLVDPAARGAYPIALDYPLALEEDREGVIELDPRPAVLAVARECAAGVPRGTIATRFHAGLARATADACARIAGGCDLDTVVLSGGVFQNRVLLERTAEHLCEIGLRVLFPRRLPPNDGGISYGQAAVAAARLAGS